MASKAIPSTGEVPLPNSSIRQSDRDWLCASIALIWVKSSIKDDEPLLAVSVDDIRVKIRSVMPITARSHGSHEPICARYMSAPTCLMYTVLPKKHYTV